MEIGRISGTTRVIGKSQGYFGLPLRDIELNCSVDGENTPAMQTAWFPTPKEIEEILAGAPIILTVIGTRHPPVMLSTGLEPKE